MRGDYVNSQYYCYDPSGYMLFIDFSLRGRSECRLQNVLGRPPMGKVLVDRNEDILLADFPLFAIASGTIPSLDAIQMTRDK